ncbi:MAG TPA: hypothetical protein VGX92_14145 [Pyrinomonadaceae bacterium]|jgi:hypothetical protein|nr:hypothetical protein [Pyrinomonadaceae bacterium]
MQSRAETHALSQLDAFFVAYQERTGILMQLGIDVEVKGELRRERLEQALAHLVGRWPRLGQTLHKRLTGLCWRGESRLEKMLQMADGNGAVARWRNQPIDPFCEPPFQLLCIPGRDRSTLSFRAHHCLVDGEAFFDLCADTLRILARVSRGEELPTPEVAAKVELSELISPARLLRQGKLLGMWRYTRWLAAEAKAGRSISLKMRAREPGDIATCERLLGATAFDRFKERAASARVAPAWLCAAAWVRAIGAWNHSNGDSTPGTVSLEVPVSLRFGRGGEGSVGNFISPLVLLGEPSQPLEQIARGLQEQLKKGLRQRSHLGVPLLSAPARYLPWPLFRRLAVNTTSTGFATSHFTWLEQKASIYTEISNLSGGAFRILDHHIYTPVCLHMGAALAVAAQPEDAKLSLTYRLTAFTGTDAETLLGLVIAELLGDQRQQRHAAR